MLISLLLASAIAVTIDPDVDLDGDGLTQVQEDSNGNKVLDEWETDPLNADTDGGGQSDGSEVAAKQNPRDPNDDAGQDPDNDGLMNAAEDVLHTDRNVADTDKDTVSDAEDPFPLDPQFAKDADNDKLPDEYEQVHGMATDADNSNADSDNDGLTDAQEFAAGTDPQRSDSDGDGIADGAEVAAGSDPLENPCLEVAGSEHTFEDIAGHWSSPYVVTLNALQNVQRKQRIVRGQKADAVWVYRPDDSVTRVEFLSLLLLSTCTPVEEAAPPATMPSDVRLSIRKHETAEQTYQRQLLLTALARGVIRGYPDGTLRPDGTVNRAEAAEMLTALVPVNDDPETSPTFPADVASDAWYAPAVELLLESGVAEGRKDGLFHPEALLTRGEAAKLILLALLQNPHVNGYVVPTDQLP